jgi:hypothetical protein
MKKNINKGQIWTIYGKEDGSSMLVLTVSVCGEYWRVIPVHENIGLRTEMDPVIDIYSEKLDEDFEAVAVVHSVTQIPEKAFSEESSYFGKVDDETLTIVKEHLSGYYQALSKLSEIQHKEAFDPDYEEDYNDITPITSGIFELLPSPTCELDELIEFNDEYCKPLMYWQEIGICEAESESVSEISEQPDLVTTIVKAIKISWDKLVEQTVKEPSPSYGLRGDKKETAPIKITVEGVELAIHIKERNDSFRLMSIEADVDHLEAVAGDVAAVLKKIGNQWIPESKIVFSKSVTIKFIKEKNGISVEIVVEK